MHGPMAGFETAIERVSPEYRQAVEMIIGDQRQNMAGHMHSMFSTMQEARAILIAEEFNSVALDRVHTRVSETDDSLKHDILVMLKRIANTLPEEDRILFFEQAMPDTMPPMMRRHVKNDEPS